MKYKNLVKTCLAVLLCAFIITACTTTDTSTKTTQSGSVQTQQGDTYIVLASGSDFNIALMEAYKIAVQKAVIDMIGPDREKELYSTINKAIYQSPLKYKKQHTVEDKYTGTDKLVYVKVSVKVDLEKLKLALEALGVLSQTQSTSGDTPQTVTQTSETSQTKEQEQIQISAQQVLNNLKPEEKKILEDYVANLLFMVYFEEENSLVNKEYMRYAVARINNNLAVKNFSYVEPSQIKSLLEDQNIIREATQGGVTELQIVADKLGAEVYVVIDMQVNNRMVGSMYAAQANVILKIFESATGKGLGTADGYSMEMMSSSSFDIASRAAVDDAISKSIHNAIALAQNTLIVTFKNGIRYQITLQDFGTTANRLKFEKLIKLTTGFRRLERPTTTKTEVKYILFYMGLLDDFETQLFELAGNEAGFSNLEELLKRQNTLVLSLGYK